MTTPEPENFEQVGGFKLFERISKGGMGTVYKALQISMDRAVAVKVLAQKYTKDQVFVDRFLKEARAAARLSHPNIVQAIDVGDEEGAYYFVMELVDGSSLSAILRRKARIPPLEACSIIMQIARALEHAAHFSMLHLDIKPANIMLTSTGLAKLADFGLARHMEDEDMFYAHKKVVFGTPAYMSPEQLRGVSDLDGRSDIYSLGVTFYEIVTGTNPFQAPTTKETLRKVRFGELPPAHTVDPGVPLDVSLVISNMMAHDRDERYATPSDLLIDMDALSRLQRPPIVHNLAVPRPGNDQEPRRRWGLLAVVGTVAAVMAAAIAAMLVVAHLQSQDEPTQPTGSGKPPATNRDPTPPDLSRPANDSVESELKRIVAKAQGLMDEDRFGEAIRLYTTFIAQYRSSAAWIEMAENDIGSIGQRAEWRAQDLAGDIESAINDSDLERARVLYERMERINLVVATRSLRQAARNIRKAERQARNQAKLRRDKAAREAYVMLKNSSRKLLADWRLDETDDAIRQFMENESYASAHHNATQLLTKVKTVLQIREAVLKAAAKASDYRLSGKHDGAVVTGVENNRILATYRGRRISLSLADLSGDDLAALALSGATDPVTVHTGLVFFLALRQDYPAAYAQITALHERNENFPLWIYETERSVLLAMISIKSKTNDFHKAHKIFLYLKKHHGTTRFYQSNLVHLRDNLVIIRAGYMKDMTNIPQGDFLYGSATLKKRIVYLPSFYIDTHEVTNAEYAKFLAHLERTPTKRFDHEKQPTSKKGHRPLAWARRSKGKPNHPVVGVDWWDAYAYSQWNGKRLPFELEWEKAARGVDGRKYPWGNTWQADYYHGPPRALKPKTELSQNVMSVGKFPKGRSPYGIYDMAGNAREWVHWDSGREETRGDMLPVRGGSFMPPISTCAADYRFVLPHSHRDKATGFRCAMDAPDLEP